MNKKSFERELSAKLSGLPDDEREKILDYYDELYYEKLEKGESERDIIASFGTPAEIARLSGGQAALDDFVGEKEDSAGKSVFTESRVDDPSESIFTKTTRKVKSVAGSVFTNKTFWIVYFSLFFVTIPLTIAFFSVVFSLALAAVIIVISFFVAGIALTIAGPAYLIYGCVTAFSNTGAGLAHIGLGLVCLAIGIVFVKSWDFVNWLRIQIFVKEEKRKQPSAKKRKVFRWAGIFTLIFLLSGAVVFCAGFALADWDYRKLDVSATVNYTESGADAVISIEIDVLTRGVEVIKSSGSDGEVWRVEASNPEKCELSVIVVEGVLKVTDKCDVHKYIFNIHSLLNAFHGANQKITIYVPDTIEQLKVENSTGTFRMGGFDIDKCDVKVTTGDIRIWDCTFENFSVKATTGSIRVENCQSGVMNAKATTGDIRIENFNADEMTGEATTGTVRFLSVTSRYIKATVTTGDVRVEVIGNKNDYDIKSSVTTGNNNAGNQDRDGDKKIILGATTGNVRLSFK